MKPMMFNLTLLAVWLVCWRRSLTWLVSKATQIGEPPLTLLLVFVGVVFVVRGGRLARPAQGPWLAWGLVGLLPLVSHLWVHLSSLKAVVMVLSAYGLLGLFVSPALWARARALALLAVLLLPIRDHIDTLLGLPTRELTATVVSQVLGTVDSSTVLKVAGGYAYIDVPCSGVASLWSSMVVLALAYTLAKRVLTKGSLWVLFGTFVLLFVSNAVRVLTVVGLHHSLGQPLFAEIVHTPIGVVGFVLSLAPALFFLHTWPKSPAPTAVCTSAPRWATLLLLTAMCFSQPKRASFQPSVEPLLPEFVHLTAASEQERSFFLASDALLKKGTFTYPLSGSVAVVSSRNWTAHHVPRWCYETDGWVLRSHLPQQIDGVSVRFATLTRGEEVATAVWWFQSQHTLTDDHTRRIASGLAHADPWLMVSLKLDEELSPSNKELATLVRTLTDLNQKQLER